MKDFEGSIEQLEALATLLKIEEYDMAQLFSNSYWKWILVLYPELLYDKYNLSGARWCI